MNCPECDAKLKQDPLVIITYPETYHYYCKDCNALWDKNGDDVWECFASPRKNKVKEK